ncbi:MAG: TspO/MBR family protein [Candidatus Burarchaeum sp.]|nr:TspO/MBR family protein [Candidatus Burarchaeum sp.]MDO8340059.1 TspO/MBR family protein [Candidatus Burarchaeum sp.]
MTQTNYAKLAAAIAVCLLVGILGSLYTMPAIPGWYAGLNKPAFTPPSWVFGPVWTSLYILMGISLYLVLGRGLGAWGVKPALSLFSIQLVLNFLWSYLFFGLRSPLAGLICIALLWVELALTIVAFSRISRKAALLLVPYLLWVTFAVYLNFSIWLMN